jgi:hypothetical protein
VRSWEEDAWPGELDRTVALRLDEKCEKRKKIATFSYPRGSKQIKEAV